MIETPGRLIDHLFRQESAKMVAVLVRIFGLHDMQIAEDVVQETFVSALKHWKVGELPDNPAAWLMQVAKRKTIDILRQHDRRSKLNDHARQGHEAAIENFFHADEIADSQLRLIFACCHPQLQERDRIALTLKIASGFSVREISRALLRNEDVIKQRLSRARAFIRKNAIDLTIPSGKGDLQERLNSVLKVLYLVFNERYYSSGPGVMIRKELCAEAMRLTFALTKNKSCQNGEVFALLALMCYQSARFDARVSMDDQIVLLPQQDRTKWDRELIGLGGKYIAQAFRSKPITVYHLEAAIASQHAYSEDYESTDWPRILKLYSVLCEVQPSPATLLSKAVVMQRIGKFQEALDVLDSLGEQDLPVQKYMMLSVKAESYIGLAQLEKARDCLLNARSETEDQKEMEIIADKIRRLSA